MPAEKYSKQALIILIISYQRNRASSYPSIRYMALHFQIVQATKYNGHHSDA